MAAHISFDRLALKEKIGQLFMCGFDGLEPTDGIAQLIAEYKLGGIIYFRRNLRDAEQVRALSAKLQGLSDAPLFISADQEGGMVVRLEEGVTVMPGAMAQGAADDAELTREAARWSGAELRSIGINMNFAPCLDVNNNPKNPVIGVRSYGENPAKVAALGMAAIAGYREGGVAAVAKHFPGHGDTETDSHHELPVVPHDMGRINAVELVPFRQATEEGADAIMTAHVVFPAFEPERLPATLSRRILTGLLRERLGFGGVIVTDCLEMNAISETIGVARGAVEAIKAGADLVLVSHRLPRQKAALDAVLEAVMTGEIPEYRIDEAARRIWELKRARGLFGGAAPEPDRIRAELAADRLCEAAITAVKGKPLLPKEGKVAVIWTEARVGTEVVEVIDQAWTLGEALRQAGRDVVELRIGLETTVEEAREAMVVARQADAVVFVSYDAAFFSKQAGLIRDLADLKGKRFILVAGRTPYDGVGIAGLENYLCTYENKPRMMTALAAVLTGQKQPQGKLPVALAL